MNSELISLPLNMQQKITVRETGCWDWTGALSNKGYGQVGVGGSIRSTHRVVYELLVGPIGEGLQIDHLCRNRPCCNPAHLEAVTQKTNMERTPRAQKTRCVNDHPLVGENLLVIRKKSGFTIRNCRVCNLDSQRRGRESRGAKSRPLAPRRQQILDSSEELWAMTYGRTA